MRTCPACDYRGDAKICPNDGTVTVAADDAGAAPAPPPLRKTKRKDPLVGSIMEGRYEILSRIGAGGMGAVYKARQAAMDRIVAVKVLLRSLAENEDSVRRFKLEARAASRLNHPNTITIHDFGQTSDGTLYIVMEFLEGQALETVIGREAPLDPVRVVHIMSQVCRSLAEAHDNGIIHRDLKPDNIFLNEVGKERDFVKVLDFGVAKLKHPETLGGDSAGTLTQAGMIFGTPKYMSPEQAQSLPLEPSSDIYALGVIMYEMLAGRAPFVGDAPLTILIQHVHEQPPPMAEFTGEGFVPPALEAVVMKSLQKDAKDRPQTATALRQELEAALATFAPVGSMVGSAMGQGTPYPGTFVRGAAPQGPMTGVSPQGMAPAGPQTGWGPAPADGTSPRETTGGGGMKGALIGVGATLLAGLAAAGIWFSGILGPPAPAETPDLGTIVAVADTGPPDAGAEASDATAVAAADAGRPDAGKSPQVAEAKPPKRPPRKPPRKPTGSGGDVRPAKETKVKLRLRSTPPGAQVYVNGNEYVGLAPTTIFRRRGTMPITFTFRKKGYEDGQTIKTLLGDQTVAVTLKKKPEAAPAPVAASDPKPGPKPAAKPDPKPTPPPPPPKKDDSPFGKFNDFKAVKF